MPAIDAAQRLIAEGNRAEDAGDAPRARELYRQAVELAPRLAAAHLNLGNACESLGELERARACYERSLALEPASAPASYNLGKLLYAQGACAEAARRLAAALAMRPDFAEAHIVHGYALHRLGQLPEAAEALRAGLRGRPDDVHARASLFHVLDALGDRKAAALELEALLSLRPEWTQARYHYGTTLMALGREAEAETALRRVLEDDARFAAAYRMLASLLHRQGRIDETLALCEAGRAALPDSVEVESFELFALNFSDRISDDALFQRHRAFGERIESTVAPRFAFHHRAGAKRVLRVGYVSGDLSYHPVALFLLPVLERHDRARFEPFCYATGQQEDGFTRRLQGAAKEWRKAHALSDAELADAIHADAIDILVDLSGHSGTSRLGVFARKPAPVQAAWLGYLNTTGLTRIDYRITDGYCDPPGAEHRHTEQLLRLPRSQWCYRPFIDVDAARAAPFQRNGYVTFGSLTQPAKLTRTTLDLWVDIFRTLRESRLLVAGVAQGVPRERLLVALESAGIAASRVRFAPFLPVNEYLRLFGEIDIALDPTPYSGGTTTCDALWMGVPVLTLPGTRSASRSAASIVTFAGLAQWIANDPADYVRRAVGFASDGKALADLRGSLRERMLASPLTDEGAFVRELEQGFENMWRRYCERAA